MPRLKNAVPKYRLQKRSGQAIVTLNGRGYLLGPHGTDASRRQYDRLIAEWLDRGRQPAATESASLTIAELAARYLTFAEGHYVRDGKPSTEVIKLKSALKPLLSLYLDLDATEFAPAQLKVVRADMVKGGWSRNYTNSQVGVLVRMFKWAAVEGLLPPEIHAALSLLEGLRRGRTEAPETEKVRPVDNAVVEATLPHLSPVVRAMIGLQQATAMRPGELVILRPCDIDRSSDVWEYRPQRHKTEHHEHDRLICIGPKGQEILQPYLHRAAEAYCFSPQESIEWYRQQRHESRKTPIRYGNKPGSNRKPRPQRTPGKKYDVGSYRRAIQSACDIAFPAPEDVVADKDALAAWRNKHRWAPHQLRHTMATKVRKEFDLEAAKAVLGHSATNVTGIYAEVDRQRAVEVARKIG